MSTASQGRAREHKVRDHFAANGWVPIMRAAASRGPADLLLGHTEHGGALIQVGAKSKRLGPADRARLCDAAELIGALPLLATVLPRGVIVVWVVDRGMPAGWARFEVGT